MGSPSIERGFRKQRADTKTSRKSQSFRTVPKLQIQRGQRVLSPEHLKRVRSDLMAAAQRRSVVNYGELMKRYHLSRGHVLSRAIEEVDRAENEQGMPGFAAIVVRADTGFPGGGYFCDDGLPPSIRRSRARSPDPRLSAEEIRHVKQCQQKIWAYYRDQ